MNEQQIKADINAEITDINAIVAGEVSKTGVSTIKPLSEFLSFLRWVKEKYNYITNGSNTRSVMQGEIYYCNFGHNIGSEQNGLRPAIVLQNNTGNIYSPATIVAPITNTPKKLPVHVEIKKVLPNSQTTGVIRIEQMRVIAKCRLGVFIEKADTSLISWDLVKNAMKIELDIK